MRVRCVLLAVVAARAAALVAAPAVRVTSLARVRAPTSPAAVRAPVARCVQHRRHVQRARSVAPLASSPVNGGEDPDPRFNPAVKLLLCLAIDLVGASSYVVPGAGEGTDIAWAPVQAALVNWLFGNALISGFAFVEELLPGTDFIPTATIAWFWENSKRGSGGDPDAPPRARAPPPRARAPPSPPPRRRPDSLRDGAIDVDVS